MDTTPCPSKASQNSLARAFDRHSLIFLVILILSAGLRLWHWISLTQDPLSVAVTQWSTFDQSRFVGLAQSFLNEGWIGPGVTRYSPAYSYFIALVFLVLRNNIFCVTLIQSLVGVLSLYFFYKAGTLLFKDRSVGLLTAAIAGFYAPFLFYEGVLIRASLIACFNLFGFYFLLKALRRHGLRNYIWGGLLIGLSFILRPNALLLFILPYLFFAKGGPLLEKAKVLLTVVLTVILTVAPLAVRNHLAGREVLISHQGPSTFWIGNTPDATGIGLYRSPLRTALAEEAGGDITKTLFLFFREVRKHPAAYLTLYLRKTYMFFNAYEIPANISFNSYRQTYPALKAAFLDFHLICPLAFLGIFLARRKFEHTGLLYGFLFVLSVSVILFHIQGRYRNAAAPFFILLAGYAAHWFFVQMRSRNRRLFLRAVAAFLLLFTILMPWPPIILRYFGDFIRIEDHENFALSYY